MHKLIVFIFIIFNSCVVDNGTLYLSKIEVKNSNINDLEIIDNKFIYNYEVPAKTTSFSIKPISNNKNILITVADQLLNEQNNTYTLDLVAGINYLIIDLNDGVKFSRYVLVIDRVIPKIDFLNLTKESATSTFKKDQINKIVKYGFIISTSSSIKTLLSAVNYDTTNNIFYYINFDDALWGSEENLTLKKDFLESLVNGTYYCRAFVIDDYELSYLSNTITFTLE